MTYTKKKETPHEAGFVVCPTYSGLHPAKREKKLISTEHIEV